MLTMITVDNSLPQGAPTSPYLASVSFSKLDKKIYSYCKRRNYLYTRYFDDISISGKNISDKDVNYFERIISESGFACNDTKRKFFKENDNKIVNSIMIKKDTLSVTNNYKNEIKNIYQGLLEDNSRGNQRIFAGKFGFYLHVNKREALLFLENLKKGKV